MATITTLGSGDWTSTTASAPWPGGTLPTAADVVVIADTHTVTLNAAVAAVALSVTVNNGGSLTSNGTNIVSLTVEKGITQQTNSTVSIDYSGDVTKTFTLTLNNVRGAAAAANKYSSTGTATTVFKGYPKTRWTTLSAGVSAAGTTASVTAATGWQTGDKICFATTQAYNATPRVDMSTGTNTVSGTSLSNLTAFSYDHASGGYVGNFSSNLKIKTNTAGDALAVRLEQNGSTRTGTRTVIDVEFNGFGAATFPNTALTLAVSSGGADGAGTTTPYTRVGNNCFYDCRASAGIGAMHLYLLNTPVPRDNNIFYLPNLNTAGYAVGAQASGMGYVGDDTDTVVFRSTGGGIASAYMAGSVITRPKISGCTATPSTGVPNAAMQFGGGVTITDADVFSNKYGFFTLNGKCAVSSSRIGTQYSSAATNETLFFSNNLTEAVLTDTYIQSGGTFGTGLITTITGWFLQLKNKNADPAVQEIYNLQSNSVPAIQRDASTTSRSTSSVAMTCNTSTAITYSFDVLAKAGQTITVLTLVRKSSSPAYGASTLPKVTISGLGITPVTSTMSGGTAADTWETLTTSATNSGSADGLLTVTFTAQSSTAGAKAYFAGTPVAPFVSRCRHYGYTFDETNPVRTTNITTSASEATAAAYTGMTVTWGTSVSPVALSADQTFQKLYDYTQAQGCLNVGSAMPLSGAGVAGSPALFAAANLTTTGYTLNGDGSISMDTYTLTASVPWTYTYTGGTFSQASTVPSFNGGTLAIGDGGTYTFTMVSSTLVTVTPSGSSDYTFSSGSFTGTLTVNNTTATPVTIYVPSGTTTSSTGNTGGAITFSAPIVQQTVTISGAVVGSRIQIYDTTSSTELYNGTPTFPYTWTDPSAASASRDIRLRVANQSTVTAYNFIEASIGTCGTSTGDAAISYLVSQTADTTYNTNAIDGSTVTGITITPSPARVKISLGGGSVTWPQIYAYQVYWLFTATGIADEAAFISAPDTANYLLTNFEIRNDSATPLTITGGYGRDAVTGLVVDIIDVAGSTGNIYPAPDHAIPYSSGSGLTAGQAAQLTAIESSVDVPTSTVPALTMASTIEGTITLTEAQRLALAVLAGKVSGAGTGTEIFRDTSDTKDRITATVDSSGNRTVVMRDVS